MYIIYKHTNKFNGKAYIGYTKFTLEERWLQHINSAIKLNSKSIFHSAIRKYGINNWEHEILLITKNLSNAKILEIKMINEHWTFINHQFGYGYNMTSGGDGHSEGYKTTIQTRLKQSKIKLGKKLHNDHIRKISISLTGRIFSTTHLKHLSLSRIGTKNSFYGKKQTIKHSLAMKQKCGKRVKQLTLDNKLIKIFETISDAYNETKICHITDVCKHKRTSAGGFKWEYFY